MDERVPLPAGVEVYELPATGTARLVNASGTVRLDPDTEFLQFIDAGQRAQYLIGDARTAPERPSNATYKIGVVRPHSSFTPHAHRGEHFVLSLGYAACTLYDDGRQAPHVVRLAPGMLIRIPELVPHSFANRAGRPLLILAANTGFGIDHEDYAITAAEAERRASLAPGYPELAKALRALGPAAANPGRLSWAERAASGLRRLAGRLEQAR
jgi:mannose-6-phosphate isomerase-like protein (cupin superfamily)